MPNAVKADMFDYKTGNRLVWSTFYANDGITKKSGETILPAMDGLQEGYRSVLIKMPYDYYALAIINSGDLQPNEMGKMLIDSFNNAASY